jgi:hypothetical protein
MLHLSEVSNNVESKITSSSNNFAAVIQSSEKRREFPEGSLKLVVAGPHICKG